MMRAPQKLRNKEQQQHDVAKFEGYFKKKEVTRKRGRPRKKKYRPQAAHKCKQEKTLADDNHLKRSLAGVALKGLRSKKQSRINWDVGEYKELRSRLANSWQLKTDLFKGEETFHAFCVANGIDRNVLARFMKKNEGREGEAPPSKRGRKPFFSQSVMRHLCEGMTHVVLCCECNCVSLLCFGLFIVHVLT